MKPEANKPDTSKPEQPKENIVPGKKIEPIQEPGPQKTERIAEGRDQAEAGK